VRRVAWFGAVAVGLFLVVIGAWNLGLAPRPGLPEEPSWPPCDRGNACVNITIRDGPSVAEIRQWGEVQIGAGIAVIVGCAAVLGLRLRRRAVPPGSH
jgi:hypothetical protein